MHVLTTLRHLVSHPARTYTVLAIPQRYLTNKYLFNCLEHMYYTTDNSDINTHTFMHGCMNLHIGMQSYK